MSRPFASRLVPVALVVLGAAACARTQGATSQRPRAAAIAVRTAPVVSKDVVYGISALGSLEAQDLVQVTAEVDGAVSEVLFQAGDRVTPQTVLLRIAPDRYRLEADRAEANYRKAVADAARAGQDLERREQLAREQLVPVEELNRSRSETEGLEAEAAAMKAAWALAERNRARSELRPPQRGVIDTRRVETGQYVRMGDVLATLVDTSRLRLRFKVSDAQSLRARRGDEVGFRVAALGDARFVGRIYHVGEVADPTTRQVEVLAWVANPGQLKPGFFAEVAFAAETRHAAIVVPEGAVQASEVGFVAYVVRDGQARLRPIQIGLRTEQGEVEIKSGLTAGETVVVEGSDRIADGVPVEEEAAAGAGAARAGAGQGTPAGAGASR